MHLVIDNQSPIIAGEEREMRKILFHCFLPYSICLLFTSGATVRENLIGTDCNRANFFAITCVLAYHLRWNIRLVDNFLYPLPHSNRVRGKDQGGALNISHRD